MDNNRSAVQFQADLNSFAVQLRLDVRIVIKKIIFDLFKSIVERNPVDTGRCAGSWDVSLGAPSNWPGLPEGEYGGHGSGLSLERLEQVDFSNPFGTWYITNNLPYVECLEYGLYPGNGPKTVDGYSTQAPAGFVRISVAEEEATIDGLINP